MPFAGRAELGRAGRQSLASAVRVCIIHKNNTLCSVLAGAMHRRHLLLVALLAALAVVSVLTSLTSQALTQLDRTSFLVRIALQGAATQGTGVSVSLTDDELERLERERTRNVVRLAATDQLNSEIVTNRTRGK